MNSLQLRNLFIFLASPVGFESMCQGWKRVGNINQIKRLESGNVKNEGIHGNAALPENY